MQCLFYFCNAFFFLKIRRQNSNALVIKSHLKQVDQIVRLIISYGNSGFFIKYWQTSLVQIIDVAVFYKNIQILSILSLATRRDTRPKFPASTAVPVLAFPFSFLEVPVNRWTEWLRSPLNIKEANEQAKIYVKRTLYIFFFMFIDYTYVSRNGSILCCLSTNNQILSEFWTGLSPKQPNI